jgi:alpha-galactosidase
MTPPVNIQTVQIDAGYHPHVGDWLEPSEKFPNGIQASVKEILINGYKAGIWIGPYMVGTRSKLYS